ncbi:peptidoglycan DD-metalloendopeptidase family protein [Haloplasma contractile]|uniref:Peptidase M23B protein n=1 Tax=Haloplasma contractile SSD-17B TaxID=1033810 RepID=F7PWY9_9MOLU|nr:peptidoglycan DD-metalloendopeptidase family protein [Haloplasma contractile]ERJ12772.1 peptidase M23B protein [Haloplasma contractile SSD-17B]
MNRDIERIKKKNKYRSKFYHEFRGHKPKRKNELVNNPLPKIYKREHKESKLNIDEHFLWRVTYRVLISAIILLVVLISRKQSSSVITHSVYKMYSHNINFMKIDRFITTNLGALFPIPKNDDLFVSGGYVGVDNTTDYRDGVMVSTDLFAPVSSHIEGIVTNVYTDEELGKVIEIQDINNNVYVYAGVEDVKVGIYSRIQYGEVLGIAKTSSDYNGAYYLAVRNNNNYLDVVEVISLGNDEESSINDDDSDGEVTPIGFGSVDE